MVVLGLILLAAAVVAIVEGILANTGMVTVHMWGWTWHFELFWAMVCGIGIALVAMLGLWLMTAGSARAVRARRDHRALARENARLAAAAEERAAAHRAAENRAAQKPAVVAAPPAAQPTVQPTAHPATPMAPPAGAHAVPEGGYPSGAVRQDGMADGSYDGQREHHSMLGRVLHRR